MSQLTDNLSAIVVIKSNIKDAIEAKGVSMSGVSFGSYADKIGEIQTGGQFVTEPLSVSVNGTYTPGQGVDGFSQVTVDVPQSATGFTEKDVTERNFQIINLNNSASFVAEEAFYNDNNLQTVELNNCLNVGLRAFYSCTNIQTVSLPICVRLDYYCFFSCSSLVSIYVPLCRFVGSSAFGNCRVLTSINMPICSYVGNGAFYGCYQLEYVSMPKCTSVMANGFTSCRSLVSLYLPECKDFYGAAAANCSVLTTVTLPTVLTLSAAFSSCSNLISVTLDTEVYSVPNYSANMFNNTPLVNGSGSIYVDVDLYNVWITTSGWSSLSSRFVSSVYSTVPLLSYSDSVLYGRTKYIVNSQYSNSIFLSISDLSQITGISLPECLLMFPTVSFSTCSYLSYVYLPKVSLIQDNKFNGCYSLKSVDIPMCVEIGTGAFSRCSSLSEINLPACEKIGNNAFMSCVNLYKCTISIDTVCSLNNTNVFQNTPISGTGSGSIYVPASLVDAYKSARNWSQYSSHIFPIPE